MQSSQYFILNLFKMSNSSSFSRIFTLQSSFGSVPFILFGCFLDVLGRKNIISRMRKDLFEPSGFKISQNFLFLFPILIFSLFKCRTNSFILSLVEQFLETHFHKNNYRVRRYNFLHKK